MGMGNTWGWFLTLIKMDCNINNNNEHEWTFINDRQKGLIPTLNEMLPRAEHSFKSKWGGQDGEQYTVDLYQRSCTCRRWNLSGLPCPHSMAAMQERHQKPEVYIHACYTKATYMKAYQPLINPINGYKMWPKTGFTPVLPPSARKKVGRPRMKRIRGPEEYLNPLYPHKMLKVGQNSVFCRRCGQHGHNRRTCSVPLAEQKEGETAGGNAGRGRGAIDVQ
ncbi:hypothetical protein RHGRI_024159 [Rhododendron griersonianum]|uniref:SWIM-type domain-containing protein n=1 Tax=Rhododendron griersonianum TaxID=479676 RepID=A0AAV6JBS8_9ERIC|nr:hypothetical protein RHGRI_024159 [Rhododendron griersonianum]